MKTHKQKIAVSLLALLVTALPNLHTPTCRAANNASVATVSTAAPAEPANEVQPEQTTNRDAQQPAPQAKQKGHRTSSSSDTPENFQEFMKQFPQMMQTAISNGNQGRAEIVPGEEGLPKILDMMVPLFTIIFPFVTIMVCVALILTFRHRRQRVLHETIRAMIEKGMAIPPELLSRPGELSKVVNPPVYRNSRERDFRKGLILFFVGFGLFITHIHQPGIICMLIGAAFFISGMLTKREDNLPPRT